MACLKVYWDFCKIACIHLSIVSNVIESLSNVCYVPSITKVSIVNKVCYSNEK